MTKEYIEIIRQSLIPFVKKELLDINYEGLGASDAEEFEKDLNEVLDMAIKTLEQEAYYKNLAQSYEKTINKLTKAIAEQQPSDDCVSRQMAIMCLTQEWNEKDDKTISKFIKKLKALPPVTPTQSWIPVSERLPKESDGAVLIAVNGAVKTGRYSEFSKTWYKGDMRGVGGDDPIAWQPLPKPYEEKRGSEDGSN